VPVCHEQRWLEPPRRGDDIAADTANNPEARVRIEQGLEPGPSQGVWVREQKPEWR
jgi:hypothetical protein